MANDLSELRGAITATVADVLCDDAVLRPASGAAEYDVRVNVTNPREPEQLQGASWVRAKPRIKTPVSGVSGVLVTGDVFVTAGRKYRVASAPKRPGSGMWWEAEVDDIGAA